MTEKTIFKDKNGSIVISDEHMRKMWKLLDTAHRQAQKEGFNNLDFELFVALFEDLYFTE